MLKTKKYFYLWPLTNNNQYYYSVNGLIKKIIIQIYF